MGRPQKALGDLAFRGPDNSREVNGKKEYSLFKLKCNLTSQWRDFVVANCYRMIPFPYLVACKFVKKHIISYQITP
jgi:hypothetical protein